MACRPGVQWFRHTHTLIHGRCHLQKLYPYDMQGVSAVEPSSARDEQHRQDHAISSAPQVSRPRVAQYTPTWERKPRSKRLNFSTIRGGDVRNIDDVQATEAVCAICGPHTALPLPVNLQLVGFYNIERPDNGPDWTLRFQIALLCPKR
jgi:hypothetical protein